MKNQTDDLLEKRSKSLSRVLRIVAAKGGNVLLIASAILGFSALFPNLQWYELLSPLSQYLDLGTLKTFLTATAGTVGVEAMGSLLDRLSSVDSLSDDELLNEAKQIVDDSGVRNLLTKEDFFRAFALLRKGQRTIQTQGYLTYKALERIEQILFEADFEPTGKIRKQVITPQFIVPYGPNSRFLGREDELQTLHEMLHSETTKRTIPVMVTGMAGVGKSQLALTYAYKHRHYYSDGVYWIDAALDWQSQLAQIAEMVGLRIHGTPLSDTRRLLVQEFALFLNEHPNSLLIFDNVADARELLTFKAGAVITELTCSLLFTTRRMFPNLPFQAITLEVLSTEDSLKLLLNTNSRRNLLDSPERSEEEIEAGMAICEFLGYLPLALTLAAAYLAKFLRVSLVAYLGRLRSEGRLETLDDSKIEELDLVSLNSSPVTTTFISQWNSLDSLASRLLLQTAAVLDTSVRLDRGRLSLFTGLSDRNKGGYPTEFDLALTKLTELWLIETQHEYDLRIHPLVRELALVKIPNMVSFVHSILERVINELWQVACLSREVTERSIDNVIEDLRILENLARSMNFSWETSKSEKKLKHLMDLLEREAHHLRLWNASGQPGFFLQQLRNRCLAYGANELQLLVEKQLTESNLPYFAERFRTGSESNLLVRTLSGHTCPVNSVAISKDGGVIVSGSADHTARIWDTVSGQTLVLLEGHTGPINAVVILSDTHQVATASADGTLGIWDISTGQLLSIFRGHQSCVNSIDISSNGQFIASASADRTIIIWQTATGEMVRQFRGHSKYANRVVILEGHQLIASTDADNLKIWALDSGELIAAFNINGKPIRGLTRTPNGDALVLAVGRDLHIWSPRSRQFTHSLAGSVNGIRGLKVTPDGSKVFSVSEDNKFAEWDLGGRRLSREFRAHSNAVLDIAFGPNSNFAVTASADNSLKMWDLSIEEMTEHTRMHVGPITKVAVMEGEQRAITASWDCTLKLWDLSNGAVIRTFDHHIDRVTGVCLMSRGRKIVSCSADETILIWDSGGYVDNVLEGHSGFVRSVAAIESKGLIISASGDTTLKLWDLAQGVEIMTLSGHSDAVMDVAVTTDESYAVSASQDGTLRLWNLESGQTERIFRGHEGRVSDVVITPDGKHVVSGGNDCTLRIWSLWTEEEPIVLSGHVNWLRGLAISPNGRFVASTSWDSTLRLWDIYAQQEILKIAFETAAWCCEFDRSGQYLIVGDVTGALHILNWISK